MSNCHYCAKEDIVTDAALARPGPQKLQLQEISMSRAYVTMPAFFCDYRCLAMWVLAREAEKEVKCKTCKQVIMDIDAHPKREYCNRCYY